MDTLKKLFPFSFTNKADIGALIVNILLYIVAGVVAGVLIGICALIPIIGIIVIAVGSLIDLYVLVGIILSILDYCKVLK